MEMDYKTMQEGQTIEERMAPYARMVEKLRAELKKYEFSGSGIDEFHELEAAKKSDPVDFGKILGFKDLQDYTELIAALAFFEDYELLQHLLNLRDFTLKQDPEYQQSHEYDVLNKRVRPQFAHFEPTPLYFITARKTREKMSDPCKMVRFLASRGANPNVSAGDSSTPLWNQTHNDCPVELLQTLLEVGADPNEPSRDEEREWLPLPYCLGPTAEEDGELRWRPDSTPIVIQKATLLLEHGADPNLANPGMPDLPPLMLAIAYGFPEDITDDIPLPHDAYDLIEALLKAGADPNFTDEDGCTPLSFAAEKELTPVVELLLHYGATMPTINNAAYGLTDEEFKERAAFFQEKRQEYFAMEAKYEKRPELDPNDPFIKLLCALQAEDGAALARPAEPQDVLHCDNELKDVKLPELPADYAYFLKICNGYAFDSVEFYGLKDIIAQTIHFFERCGDGMDFPQLCIGQRNGDCITYNPHTKTYQLRDHETAFTDVWEEADNFVDFFQEVVGRWTSVADINLREAQDDSQFEKPKVNIYCKKCDTINFFYDDSKQPYRCSSCGEELTTDDQCDVTFYSQDDEKPETPKTPEPMPEPTPETKYKTTFNYLLTHRVIPQLLFYKKEHFYENILPSPENMQVFMKVAVDHATKLAAGNPEVEPPYPIDNFTMGFFGDSMERGVVRIRIPNCKEVCDCVEIAFPIMCGEARYFTNEFSINPYDNERCFILGEWKLEGDDDFRHTNYGKVEPGHGDNFAGAVVEIAYGGVKSEK